MIYLDTSVLVAALTGETRSQAVQEWLAAQGAGPFMISWLVEAEFSAALSIKMRRREIDSQDRAVALGEFRRYVFATLKMGEIAHRHFRLAAVFADRHESGLRAADAIHLAIAADYGANLCTLDQGLYQAGPQLGVATTIIPFK